MSVGYTVNIAKIPVLPEAIHGFSAHPTEIPKAFSTEIEQTILKCTWNHRRPQTATANLRRKNKVGGIAPPGIRPDGRLQSPRQHGLGMKMDMQISGTERRAQK